MTEPGWVWKEPFDVHDLVSHEDPRGQLFEILRFKDESIPGEGQIYMFSIEPLHRRGDHYHMEKREWFTGVHGDATLLLTAMSGEQAAFQLSPNAPKVVYAGPGVTHAVINESEEVAVIVSYGSEQHEPTDTDTYSRTAYPGYKKAPGPSQVSKE
jgi:oxalate decarboxylase/phosphoglucose isomerase-like protein (cupin superfamily)